MNKLWQEDVISILDKKQPKRAELTKQLMEILGLNQESVYKRFRKDDCRVLFSVNELMKISDAFNVSFGHIIDGNSRNTCLEFVAPSYVNPSEYELKYLKNLMDLLDDAENYSDLEYVVVSNKLPRDLFTGYEYLRKFQLLKLATQYTSKENTVHFKKTALPKELSLLAKKFNNSCKQIKSTTYIFDHRIFENLITDIEYYYSASLLTEKDKKFIKKDLLDLLKNLLDTADAGGWKQTSNSVNIYISGTSVEANCSYYYSKEFQVCRMQAFGKNEVRTNDSAVIDKVKDWLEIKKRASTLISKTGEKERNAFFNKWKKKIEEL